MGFGVTLLEVCRRREVVALCFSVWGTPPAYSAPSCPSPHRKITAQSVRSGRPSEKEWRGLEREKPEAPKRHVWLCREEQILRNIKAVLP